MRKSIVLMLLCSLTFLSSSIGVHAKEDFYTLMDAMGDIDAPVASWEVIHIVEMSVTQFQQNTHLLEKQYDTMKEEESDEATYTLQPKKRQNDLTHSVRVIPHEGIVTMQFVFSSTKWDEQVESYYKLLTTNLQSYKKTGNIESSTCVKLVGSDIILNGLLNDELWEKLNVVHKQEYKDTLQQSNYEKEITAYTPMFQQVISVNTEAMNVQVVVKNKEDNKKELIIGTPLISNEY